MTPVDGSRARREHSMLHRWTVAMAVFGNGLINGPARLNQAVRQSLNPANEREARILEAQLELVGTNVRVLDYAFPVVGVMLMLLQAARSSVSGPLAAWAVLAVACAANEVVLVHRFSPDDDLMTRARENAQTIPLSMFCLLMAWGTFCFSLWTPSNDDGHLLTILVLACTLAAMSSMFAWHATAGVVSVRTILALFLRVRFATRYHKNFCFFQHLFFYIS